MIECPKCGLVAEAGKKFCRECGSPLIDPENCLESAALHARNGEYANAIEALENIPSTSVFKKKRDLTLSEYYIRNDQMEDGLNIMEDLFSDLESLAPAEHKALASLYILCGEIFVSQRSLLDARHCYEAAYEIRGQRDKNIEISILNITIDIANHHIGRKDITAANNILSSFPSDVFDDAMLKKLADTHCKLGNELMKIGKPVNAYKHYSRAKELQSMNETYERQLSIAKKEIERSKKNNKIRLALVFTTITIITISAIMMYLFYSGFIVVLTDLPATVTINSPDGSNVPTTLSDICNSDHICYKTNRIRAGLYKVQINKLGWDPVVEIISVGKNKETTLSAKLVPSYGSLSIKTDPKGATIQIDGEEYGIAPTNIDSLQAISHEVIFEKLFFLPETINVNVNKNAHEEILVELRQYEGEWVVDFGTVARTSDARRHPFNIRFNAHIEQDGRSIKFWPVGNNHVLPWDDWRGKAAECKISDNYGFEFKLRGNNSYYTISGCILEDACEIRGKWSWRWEGWSSGIDSPTYGNIRMVRMGYKITS